LRFPEFHAALLAWRRASIKHLVANAPTSIMLSYDERWVRNPDGHYVPEKPALEWDVGAVQALTELREYGRVIKAVEANPHISKHFDTLVGTPMGSVRWEAKNLIFPFLPRPRLTDDGNTVALAYERKPATLYGALEEFFVNDAPPSQMIWPTPGVTLEQGALTLEAGVVLRRLTERETATCISGGLIRPQPSMPVVLGPDHGFYALVVTRPVPKIIGEPSGDISALSDMETSNRELTEDLQSTAAVMGLENLRLTGWMEAPGWPREFSAFRYRQQPPPLWLFQGRHLPRRDARELARIWRSLRTVGRRGNPGLSLAARRLAYVSERLRPEDQMLDLMIAAEALYLTDTGGTADKGEQRYRLALRAAIWADTRRLGLTRDEVFALMKKSYDVRSSIAHGGKPSKKALRFKDEQLELAQFVERSGAVVRAGTRKAIDTAAGAGDGKFRVEWESLLL
jgi:hypothetical protein